MPLGTRELLLILRARDEATRTVHAMGRGLNRLDKDAQKAARAQMARGQAMTSMGVGMAAVGAGMATMLADMTTAAVEYNRQAALTATQLDGVKGTVKEIEDIGKRVAKAVAVPFDQVQEGLYDILSSMDVNLKEAETLLTEFSKAAVGGQVDLQDASRGTIGIMNAWNMKTKEVHRVNDVMFQLVRKGVGTYAEFSNTIGRAVPSAVRAGQSIEDLAGMMAFLTRNGLSTAMAASSAARALDAVSHPSTVKKLGELGVKAKDANGQFRPMTAIMKDLGQALRKLPEAKKVEVLQQLFKGSGGTIQARRFIDIAIKQYPELIGLTESMHKSTGALDEAYEIMADTGSTALQEVKNQWEILKTEIGSALIPVLKTLVEWVKQAFDWWNSLSDSQKKGIGVASAITAGLTILAGIVMIVVGGIAMLGAAAAALGIGMAPLIAIIAAVIAAIVGIVVAVKKFWEAGGPVVDLVKTLFHWMGEQLVDAWNELVEAVQPLLPLLKFVGAVLGGVLMIALLAVVVAIRVLAGAINWLVKIIVWLVEAITGGLITAWNTLYGIVEWIVKAIVGFFQWLYDVLVGHSIIPDLVNAVLKWFQDLGKWLGNAWNWLVKKALEIWDNIVKAFTQAGLDIYNGVLKWAKDVRKSWNDFWKNVGALWDANLKNIKRLWSDFLANLGHLWNTLTAPIRKRIDQWVDGVKNAFENAKKNVSRIWESIKGPLKVPVNFMIDLYNKGIADMANKLASFVGIKGRLGHIAKFAEGGVLPGYTPGRDIYAAPMAAFSGGEAIMRPEFTKGVGRGWVDRMNLIARQSGVEGVRRWMGQMGGEGMAFAKGGVMPGGGVIVQRFGLGGILEKIGDFVRGVKDFAITNIRKAARTLFDSIIGNRIPGGGFIRDLIQRIPVWMRDILLGWMKNKVETFGGGKGVGAAVNFARAQAGKPYVWGGVGPGGYDCSGFMSAIWNVIHGKKPYARQFTTFSFTGAQKGPLGFQRNLRSGFMVGVTNAGVGHMAGTLGGKINVESRGSAGVVVGGGARGFNNSLFNMRYGLRFDNGGYLQPGLTLALNQTGRPERVLDANETERYERGGGGRPVQNFFIYTQEINPRQHAADLGFELERRAAP